MLSVAAGCLPRALKVVLNAAVSLLILPLELQLTEPCNYPASDKVGIYDTAFYVLFLHCFKLSIFIRSNLPSSPAGASFEENCCFPELWQCVQFGWLWFSVTSCRLAAGGLRPRQLQRLQPVQNSARATAQNAESFLRGDVLLKRKIQEGCWFKPLKAVA